jgi:hypothetical protein
VHRASCGCAQPGSQASHQVQLEVQQPGWLVTYQASVIGLCCGNSYPCWENCGLCLQVYVFGIRELDCCGCSMVLAKYSVLAMQGPALLSREISQLTMFVIKPLRILQSHLNGWRSKSTLTLQNWSGSVGVQGWKLRCAYICMHDRGHCSPHLGSRTLVLTQAGSAERQRQARASGTRISLSQQPLLLSVLDQSFDISV